MDLLDLAGRVSREKDSGTTHIIKQPCLYYHYCCDDTDDKGWGCGYRSLQSLCSWAIKVRPSLSKEVPTLRSIQETLVAVGDKPMSHVGSHDWIGTYEACIVLDHIFDVPCKIVHVSKQSNVMDHIQALCDHFKTIGSPVMIGGDVDGASKTLLGVTDDPNDPAYLIADPHYTGPPEADLVISNGFIQWHGHKLFQNSSFYNFCLPQLSST